MPGLVPGVLPGEDVDGRDKPGHDVNQFQNFAIAVTLKVRGWPGEMLLLPSADAQ